MQKWIEPGSKGGEGEKVEGAGRRESDKRDVEGRREGVTSPESVSAKYVEGGLMGVGGNRYTANSVCT